MPYGTQDIYGRRSGCAGVFHFPSRKTIFGGPTFLTPVGLRLPSSFLFVSALPVIFSYVELSASSFSMPTRLTLGIQSWSVSTGGGVASPLWGVVLCLLCLCACCACAAGAACVLAHARPCCHTPFIINGAVSGVQRHLQPTAGGDCLRSTSSVGHSSSSFAPEDAANGTGDQATSTTFHYGQLSGSEESERGLLRVLKTPPAGGV